jgi:HTH-type transcriptional regulator / antitoxin HigA
METMTATTPEQLIRAWSSLQALAPIRVIRTEQHYDQAVRTLNMLIDVVGMDEQHPLADVLDTLGTLIHAYEAEQPAMDLGVTNRDLLQLLMDQHDITIHDLTEIGDSAVVRELLTGKQTLTMPQRHALARRFGVTPETFVAH